MNMMSNVSDINAIRAFEILNATVPNPKVLHNKTSSWHNGTYRNIEKFICNRNVPVNEPNPRECEFYLKQITSNAGVGFNDKNAIDFRPFTMSYVEELKIKSPWLDKSTIERSSPTCVPSITLTDGTIIKGNDNIINWMEKEINFPHSVIQLKNNLSEDIKNLSLYEATQKWLETENNRRMFYTLNRMNTKN